MLLIFYFSILSAIACAGCKDLTEKFCALANEITSDNDKTLFFENDVVGFKSFSTFDEFEFRNFFNKLSNVQKSWLGERGPTELYEDIGFDFYHLHISCTPTAYGSDKQGVPMTNLQASWEINEDDMEIIYDTKHSTTDSSVPILADASVQEKRSIERAEGHRHIFANYESPFCSPRKYLGEEENCQTDLHDPAYLLYEPLSPKIDTGCGHGLKCMKTSADQNGGICVENEHPKVGCGQSCDDDEYCSVADGSEVTSNYYHPSSPEQIAWSSDTVTAVCPFHANLDALMPTLESLSLRNIVQRYNTPFCTCKKRLKPSSFCQLNHRKLNLDVLFIPSSSHNLFADSEGEYKFKHRNVEYIDVGCPSDRICMAPKKPNNFIDDSWGKCAKDGEEITKKAIDPIAVDMFKFEAYDNLKIPNTKKAIDPIVMIKIPEYGNIFNELSQNYRFDFTENEQLFDGTTNTLQPNYKN